MKVGFNKYKGQVMLLLATIIWGTSFVVLKQTIEVLAPVYVIAVRFFLSGIILLAAFLGKIKRDFKKAWKVGVVLGLAVAAAYITQTYGLKFTTPGRNAFLTTFYCILCPFFAWAIFKSRPKIRNFVAAFMSFIGVGFIAMTNDGGGMFSYLLGDGLTLFSGVFFAFQVIIISFGRKKDIDPVTLLVFELLTAGAVEWVFALAVELPVYGGGAFIITPDMLWRIAYMTFICTAAAQFLQILGQRHTNPSSAAVILSLEAVFGALFSIIMGTETVTATLIIGFVIMFVAILISEVDVDGFKKLKRRAVQYSDGFGGGNAADETTLKEGVDIEEGREKEDKV